MTTRRQSYWDDTLINFSVGAGAQSETLLQLVPGTLSEGFTLVRSLIRLQVTSNNIVGTNGSMLMRLGIGLTTKEAFDAGVVSDPNVNTEAPIHDWIWRDSCLVQQDDPALPPTFCNFDIRSQRKIAAGRIYLVTAADLCLGSSFSVRLTGIIRLLILRP